MSSKEQVPEGVYNNVKFVVPNVENDECTAVYNGVQLKYHWQR